MSDEEYEHYLDEYYSIMNYQYIYRDKLLFDYSHGDNGAPYDQDDWIHLYFPTHQIDMVSYEEPTDENFEDFEVVDDYPGVILDGWHYDTNLTDEYELELRELAIVKNTGVSVQVYIKNQTDNSSIRNLRIYAMPNVAPTHAEYSLIAEGFLDGDDTIKLYDLNAMIEELHPLY